MAAYPIDDILDFFFVRSYYSLFIFVGCSCKVLIYSSLKGRSYTMSYHYIHGIQFRIENQYVMLLIIYRSRSEIFYHICTLFAARLYNIIMYGYYFTLAKEIENLWWYIFLNNKVYLPFFMWEFVFMDF